MRKFISNFTKYNENLRDNEMFSHILRKFITLLENVRNFFLLTASIKTY